VYDQTQGSGAVFFLTLRITLLNSEQSLPLKIPTKLQKPGFWKEKLVGYHQVQHFGSTLLKQNLTNSSSTKRFGKFS
jgi:hypothetical protein